MATQRPTRYTLAEHEKIPFCVVAAGFSDKKTEDKICAHHGVIFDDFKAADDAAEEINDKYAAEGGNVYPDPTNGALITGFTNKVRLDGRRLYIPIKTPEGAAQ